MADELRYSMVVTPVLENTGLAGETAYKAIDTRAARVGNSGTLANGGNTPQADGEDAYDADGILQHATSGGDDGSTGIGTNGADGVWVKNTGFKYDATKEGNIDRTAPEDTVIELYCSSAITTNSDFCKLVPGASIFIPKPASTSFSINDDEGGNPVAVELVINT
jgi:hypothetical protein